MSNRRRLRTVEEPEQTQPEEAQDEQPVLESGVAPTEQHEGPAGAPVVEYREVEPPTGKPQYAALSGAELGEIRRRNDSTDWALAEAKAARDRADGLQRLAEISQAALTDFLRSLMARYDLDPTQSYVVDIERGALVAQPQARR